MKRYYICAPTDWPHPLPDASGNIPDVPLISDQDPRILLGSSHYIDLSTLGGPLMFLVVVPSEESTVPTTWEMLPHLMRTGIPSLIRPKHVTILGNLKRQDNGLDLSAKTGDSTYAFIRRLVDGLGHPAFDPENW